MIIKSNSLKFEISALYTIIMGVILTIFSGVFYIILSSTLYNDLNHELKWKTQEITQSIRSYMEIHGENPEDFISAVDKTIVQETKQLKKWWIIGAERRWLDRLDKLDFSEYYINFLSADGVSLKRSKSIQGEVLGYFQNFFRSRHADQEFFGSFRIKTQNIRVMSSPFILDDEHKYIIQVGISPQPIAQLLQNWLNSIVISIPVILLFTSFVGHLLASRILDPVKRITTAARKITYEDLSSRVESKYSYKEMNYLVDAFNDMISRLDKSFQHIAEFSAHVAHELKTPLTIIKGETELALLEKRSVPEYQRAMNVNLEESNRMLTIIEDLLYLAKIDYQPEVFRFQEVDFVEFFVEILEQSRLLVAKKDIHLSLNMPHKKIVIKADRLHLRRLFFNLIDNAIKFTPEGGRIDFTVLKEKTNIIIFVADSGMGIPEENMKFIFDRFYRGRTKESGSGLGLSIAQSIARIHKGDIEVESRIHYGATFKIKLPFIRISSSKTAELSAA